jgi:hypothetical protein
MPKRAIPGRMLSREVLVREFDRVALFEAERRVAMKVFTRCIGLDPDFSPFPKAYAIRTASLSFGAFLPGPVLQS